MRISHSLMRFLMLAALFLIFQEGCNNSKKTEDAQQEKEGEKVAATTLLQEKPKLKVMTYILENSSAKVLTFDGTDLWIGTSNAGVIKLDTTTPSSNVLFDNSKALISNGIFSITKGPDGSIWVGTYGGGLSRYYGGRWTNFNTQHGLCDSFVYDVLFDKDGAMWIATWSGINRIKGDINQKTSWSKLTKENTNMGLSDNWVYGIDIAPDGILWFGTEVGISRYDGKEWKKWNNKDGLGADPERLKIENSEQNSVLRGAHHKVQREETGMMEKDISTFNPNNVTSMIMDKNGILWTGTWGGGLTSFDGKTFTVYTMKDGLAGNYVLALTSGSDGTIWVGTEQGLSQFNGKQFTNYTTKDGLLNDLIFSLAFDSKGKLWVGGIGGITRIDEFVR